VAAAAGAAAAAAAAGRGVAAEICSWMNASHRASRLLQGCVLGDAAALMVVGTAVGAGDGDATRPPKPLLAASGGWQAVRAPCGENGLPAAAARGCSGASAGAEKV
jgi:hypothetical protein